VQQEQLAAVANSLRRERAVLEQKKQQLQRTGFLSWNPTSIPQIFW
jgi:hypothetical protein